MARLVSAEETKEDAFESSIRPDTIDEYIGQAELKENLNIFRKMGITSHTNYLKNKKLTVKSNMFTCLHNDNLLLEVIGNITK